MGVVGYLESVNFLVLLWIVALLELGNFVGLVCFLLGLGDKAVCLGGCGLGA